MNKIAIGILGAAKVAPRAIIQPAEKLGNVRVLGIAARDKARAEKFAQTYNLPLVFPDYDALLNCKEIGAVYIPLANDLHAPWVLKAIQAKKHVLVEKPICLNTEEFEAIEQLLRRYDSHVLEGVMVQHHPWQNKIAGIIASHKYGSLQSLKTQLTHRFSDKDNYRSFPEKGGGVFFDEAVYWLQFVQICLGLEAKSLWGSSDFTGPNGIDTNFKAYLDYAQGIRAELFASYEIPFAANHWLEFEQATLRIHNIFRPAFGSYSLSISIQHKNTNTIEKISFPPQDYYVNQLEFFLRIIEGKEQNLSLTQSRERVRIMEKIHLCARRRTTEQDALRGV